MAPTRRPALPKKRLDLELSGVATIGLAVVMGLAMISPPGHAGFVGYFVRQPLVSMFGNAAGWFPAVVALVGGALFIEISEQNQIRNIAIAVSLYFVLWDVAIAGGAVGAGLSHGLFSLFGDLSGGVLGLIFAILSFAFFGLSIKRLIGGAIVAGYRVRMPTLRSLSIISHGDDDDTEEIPMPRRRKRDEKKREQAEALELPQAGRASSMSSSDDGDGQPPRRPSPPPGSRPALVGGVVEVQIDPRRVDTVSGEGRWVDIESAEGRSVEGQARRTYRLPAMTLFDPPSLQIQGDESREQLLVDTFASFGVGVSVDRKEVGPSITRYELKPAKGVKISRISALSDDIALALAATSVRIEAPIPGKSAVGIEVPNAVVSVVAIREILEELPPRSQTPLPMALGKDITGRPVYGDLAKMPHLLVAGATGAGKSVCLNNIIASLLATSTPDEVQMLMIDPKRVELTVYNGIPHLVKDVITDARLAAGALFEMTKEMDSRYERFAKAGVRKVEEYNAKFPEETLPYVVIIIDELADLMLVAPAKVETTICRLAQLARATGIHLIVATQRPSVDVITGIIKANIPSRIAFAVSSQVDSRTILDMAGAERLLGRGDMLYLPIDAPKPRRAQGAFITGEEVSRLVAFWAEQARPKNLVDVDVVPIEDEESAKAIDPLSLDAARFIIESNYASTAQLQSQFQIGHPRAVRLMKGLEDLKVVGPHEGTKPRKILVGLGDLELMAPRFGSSREDAPVLFESEL